MVDIELFFKTMRFVMLIGRLALFKMHLSSAVPLMLPVAQLKSQGLSKCLPGIGDLKQGVDIYRSFPGYSQAEAKHGVLAIGIMVVDADANEATCGGLS